MRNEVYDWRDKGSKLEPGDLVLLHKCASYKFKIFGSILHMRSARDVMAMLQCIKSDLVTRKEKPKLYTKI